MTPVGIQHMVLAACTHSAEGLLVRSVFSHSELHRVIAGVNTTEGHLRQMGRSHSLLLMRGEGGIRRYSSKEGGTEPSTQTV